LASQVAANKSEYASVSLSSMVALGNVCRVTLTSDESAISSLAPDRAVGSGTVGIQSGLATEAQ
jgi:hypothetical protein